MQRESVGKKGLEPFILVLALLFLLVISPSSTAQVLNSLQQVFLKANQAFSSQPGVSSVTFHGQAVRYLGPATESGTVTLIARADGSSNVSIQLDSGNLSQAQDTFANGQGCFWAGSDNVTRRSSSHNCKIPVAWFFPELSLFSTQQPSNGTLSLSTNQSQPTLHWTPIIRSTSDRSTADLLTNVGSYDLQLDSASYLPSSLCYATHPDNNAGLDIPVRIAYSDYRNSSGVAVPFHIQRYVNGVLSVDITLANAVVAY